MEEIGLRALIRPRASDRNAVLGVAWSSILKGRSDDGHWVVSPLDNQHSNEFFISVDNKVATALIAFFLSMDELLRR